MTVKLFSTSFILTLFSVSIFAQEPCAPVGNGTPSDSPGGGCIICLPTYTGSTAGFSNSGVPGCVLIHNDQWLQVVADASGSISATAVPSNCTGGDGLDLMIYDANLVELDCDTGPGGLVIPLSVTAATVPGEIYFIRIDGWNNDICDFLLSVSGVESGSIPDPTGPMTVSPDTTLCPGATVCYSIDPVGGASGYEWTYPPSATVVSGGLVGDTSICIRYEQAGGGVVQVRPFNPCFNGVPVLTPVLVLPIPPDLKAPEFYCKDEFPVTIDGNVFNDPGVQNVVYKTALNCDSTVTYTLIQKPQALHAIDTVICKGDCFMVGDTCIADAGTYSLSFGAPFAQSNGCDSLIILKLEVFEPLAVIAPPDELDCVPNPMVTLNGAGSSSGNNVTYMWSADQGGSLSGSTMMSTATATATGRYFLTVSQTSPTGAICTARDTVLVTSSAQVPTEPVFSNPDTVVCMGDMISYSITPVALANGYTWTVPTGATFTGSGTTIVVDFGTSTGGDICVVANGDCGDSQPSCKTIVVNPLPTSNFSVTSPICITGTSTIQYTGTAGASATYTWNFNGGMPTTVTGPGPHTINWDAAGAKTVTLTVEENGCISTQSSQTVMVESELPAPVISCISTSSSIQFDWGAIPGATDYTITIDGGTPFTQTTTTYTENGLSPNQSVTITVVANGTNSCGNSTAMTMCTAQNCPTVNLNITTVSDICLDANTSTIQMMANPMGGAGGGTSVWSGSGVDAAGLFNPQMANIGPNVITLTYTEGTCPYTDFITINVNRIPDATFTFDTPICETETSTITYTGSASATASYSWDFGAGTPISGSGAGPYEIGWGSSGNQTVTLSVTENGCTSTTNAQMIIVDAPLPMPIIRCLNSTPTSVTFEWDAVPGATNYIANGPTNGVVDMTNQTFTVNGLSQGDMVTLEIIAEGNSVCGSSRNTITCQADNCPSVTIDMTPIGPFCDDATTTALIPLMASVAGGTGTFEWIGPGVDATGNFNPADPAVNPGTVQLQVTYTEGTCTYTDNLPVLINAKPSSDFTVETPICIDETSAITYTGTTVGVDFTWDFDSGSGSIATSPNDVSWTTSGTKTVSLNTSLDGCFSDETVMTVEVDDPLQTPVINCNANQNSVSFDWALVPGALTYDVNLLSGTAGVFNGTNNYTVDNLMPGDIVEIELTVTGDTDCGPVVVTADCVAQNCIDFNISMLPINPICLNGTTPFLNLADSIMVEDLTGVDIKTDVNIVWHDGSNMNDYITAPGRFFPNIAGNNVGAGSIPITAEVEYPIGSGCVKIFNSTIELIGVPNNSMILGDSVCIAQTTETALLFNLNATSMALWDFGDANVLSGSGGGPYELGWNGAAGFTDTIRVTINDRGCSTAIIEKIIRIDEELNVTDAQLGCNPARTGDDMIEFEWNSNIPNITDYEVNIITPGMTPTTSADGILFFDNLMPNTQIDIELTLKDSTSACPEVTLSASCFAKTCPPTEVIIEPLLDSCLAVAGSNSIQLNAQVLNDPTMGSGTSTWSGGSYISDSGLFMPRGQDAYPIAFSYTSDGCTYDTVLTINMYETPIVGFGVDAVICETDAANIEFDGAAHPDAIFIWDFDGGTISGTDRDPQTVSWTNDVGPQNISLSIDNSGCTAGPLSIEIDVDPELEELDIFCDQTATSTTSVGFSWNVDSNVDSYEIEIENAAGVRQTRGNQTNTDFLEDNLPATTTSGGVTIFVTTLSDTQCGEQVDSLFCPLQPCPGVNLEFDRIPPLCIDDDPVEIIVTPDGGNGTGTVMTNGPGVVNGFFNPGIRGAGSFWIVAEMEERGCTYLDSVEVVVNDLPTVDAGVDQTLDCTAEMIEIGSTDSPSNLQYEWFFNGDLVGTGRTIEVDSGGVYTLVGTDGATGCSDTDEVEVDARFSNPTIMAELNEISCFGRNDGAITVTGMANGTPPFEYSFNGAAFSDSNVLFDNLGEGVYTIVGRDANGCTSEIEYDVREPDDLTVEIIINIGENPVPIGDSVQLEAIINYAPDLLNSIQWSPADQVPICDETNLNNCITAWVSPTGQTVYSVRVESVNGCFDSDDLTINTSRDFPVYVPSAFSPRNQDGINDWFQVYAKKGPIKMVRSFLVFNRWGELMFESKNFEPSLGTDTENAWNGRYKGKKVNTGVYVFYAEIEFIDGTVEIFEGDVTVH